MSFQKRITEMIKALGIPEDEIANNIGCTLTGLMNIETGATAVDQSQLEKLAEVYSININWLLCGYGKMFIDDHDKQGSADEWQDMLQCGAIKPIQCF